MKKIILALVAVFAMSSVALADHHEGKTEEGHAKKEMTKGKKKTTKKEEKKAEGAHDGEHHEEKKTEEAAH